MCHAMTFGRCSIFCILPPYVLESVAQKGSPQQRAAALSTLATANTIRALRAAQPRGARTAQPPLGLLGLQPRKQRTIFDAHNAQTLPGVVARVEGASATGDAAVDEAYEGLGATFDFYLEIFERNSIDDEGLPLDATVHFGQNFDNALWDGQRMIFGDGDLFNRFTASLDVIGHELAHGVTQDEAGLFYFRQSGALNESMSDVFGIMIKQRKLNQTAAESNWLIGEELFTGTGRDGVALRSMKAPGTAFDDPLLGKDPQPGHMNDYVNTFADNGGVHINSGIPNRAFYLLAANLGGYSWAKAGGIWYETLRDSRIKPNTGFKRFAARTVANAAVLFGGSSEERQAVIDAWKQVGITPT